MMGNLFSNGDPRTFKIAMQVRAWKEFTCRVFMQFTFYVQS